MAYSQLCETGFEVPICITTAQAVPALGEFKRRVMDVVVNAVRLAFYWAIMEGNSEAASALTELIRDWPMDFVLIEGSTPDEREREQRKVLWV